MESSGFQVNHYMNEEGLFCIIKNDVRRGVMVCRKEKCSLLNGMLCNRWNIAFPVFDLGSFTFFSGFFWLFS